MAGLKIITPPATEPVTPAEAKMHLHVDDCPDDEEVFISGLITSAREYCEGYQNRAYITQTLELALDHWPCPPYDFIRLPRPPLQSVVSVTYTDRNSVTTTWDPSNYIVNDYWEPAQIVRASGVCWPSVCLAPTNGVKVRYVAGYGAAEDVPQRIKQAMLLLIGHWYERREAVLTGSISKEIEFSVHALLSLERVVPV